MKRGFDVLHDKALNRSITFARRDRDRPGLTGLLPHRVATPGQMVERVMVNLERLPRDIDVSGAPIVFGTLLRSIASIRRRTNSSTVGAC